MVSQLIPAWYEDALCAQVDTELFHPEQGGNSRPAKRVCAACPVRAECLDYAMRTKAMGIWGGTSQRERQALANKRAKGMAA